MVTCVLAHGSLFRACATVVILPGAGMAFLHRGKACNQGAWHGLLFEAGEYASAWIPVLRLCEFRREQYGGFSEFWSLTLRPKGPPANFAFK